ncbi:MAG TPA: MinD/ParA family protein [Bacillota bacterium]|nr:MinD/ParA family protein [Bacillota bacterium]
MDQASSLREYMHQFNLQQSKPFSRVITITSGKGGVGKTSFTLNFALGLKKRGKKVVILDMDLTTANINILMGMTPKNSLLDVLYQRKTIQEILEVGTEGIEYICGELDIKDLLELDESKLSYFWSQIQELQTYADFILIDTGAGITKELINFIQASDETILVTTPEPTSIADSYTVLKTVRGITQEISTFRLVVNRVQSFREGAETFKTLQNVSKKFLDVELLTLGYIMEDSHVRQSIKSQKPFFVSFPHCEAAKGISQIVGAYLPDARSRRSNSNSGIRGFFEKILTFGKS